jgi:hypothetical protein
MSEIAWRTHFEAASTRQCRHRPDLFLVLLRPEPVMPLLTLTLDPFLLASLLVTLPTLYVLSRPSRHPTSPPRSPLRTPLSLLLLAHTLFVLHALLVGYPPNVFSRLGLPLTASAEHIRAALLHAAHKPLSASLPPRLSTILARLASFDARIIYVRCA